MAKKVNKVEVKVEAERDGTDINVSEMATIFVTTDEYPEFELKRGIQIELTDAQKQGIIKHIKDVVLPQAEKNK